jgi:CDP-6-deoxy-D-xylo-4-hexulose-3-dehydrase
MRPRRKRIFVGEVTIDDAARRLVSGVLRSGRLSYGPFSRRFESELARLHGCSHGVFCSSGTASLHLALAALAEIDGWQPGDEVIVPSLTFMATVNIVSLMGLKPVLARVQPDTFNIDPHDVERRITARTRCIMPVHVLGLPADMDLLARLARKHRLRIVEDTCEAMFCGVRGRSVGSFGDAGCFSFYPGHHIVTGVGGMLVTNHDRLAAIARSLMNHGRDLDAGGFHFTRRGFSYKITEMEAALGVAELKTRKQRLKRRLQNAARYRAALAPFSHLACPQAVPIGHTHSYMAFACVCRTPGLRQGLAAALDRAGIEFRPLFPVVDQPAVARPGIEAEYPVAARLAVCGLYFGCHHGLSDADVTHVCNTLQDFFSSI